MLVIFLLINFARAAVEPPGPACDGLTVGPGGRRHAVESLERFDESRWAWLIGEDTELTLDGQPTGQLLHVYGAPDFALGVPGMRISVPPEPAPRNTVLSRAARFARTFFDLNRHDTPTAPTVDEGTLFLHFADEWSSFPLLVRRKPGRFRADPPPAPVVAIDFITAFAEARRRVGPRDPAGRPWEVEIWALPRPNRSGAWTAEDTRTLANLHRRLQRLAPGIRFTVRAVVRGPGYSRGPLYFVARQSPE